MTDTERLDQLAELASKTGTIYVSTDIAEAIKKLSPGKSAQLASIKIVTDSHLPRGTIMAADLKPIWDAGFAPDVCATPASLQDMDFSLLGFTLIARTPS